MTCRSGRGQPCIGRVHQHDNVQWNAGRIGTDHSTLVILMSPVGSIAKRFLHNVVAYFS